VPRRTAPRRHQRPADGDPDLRRFEVEALLDHDHEREIERRLWELDEVDAALNQLSA